MRKLKIGDKVRIVKNEDGNIITYNGSKEYNYLNYIGTVESIKCGSIGIRGLVASVDISCVELVSEEIDKFEYNYLSKDKYGKMWLHKDIPTKGVAYWKCCSENDTKDITLEDYMDSYWAESLYKIEGGLNLTKIGSNVLLIIDGDTKCYVSKESADEIKEFIKSKALK